MAASISSKSTKTFGYSPTVSQRLNKVDEDLEHTEFERRETSIKVARFKEDQANFRIGQRKLTEKEERFKNKYRWAEKQHKFRTGKCEGYSFHSIKAGLRKQDFLDTINWSPVNNARDTHFHLPDLVKQLIIESHAHNSLPAAGVPLIADEDSSQPLGHMSEEDWQLAKSRKLKPLRNRGSNTLSSQMNLDAFIDSALSEQTREEVQTDNSTDMSLTDLQSSKLIDSRFGWNKVRRAVATPAVVKSPAKSTSVKVVPETVNLTEPSQLSNSLTSSIVGAPMTAEGSITSLLEANQSTEFGESSMFESLTSIENASTSGGNNNSQARIPRAFSAAGARPSTATKASLSFHVPATSTLTRPKSAIFLPLKHASSMVAPVDELVEVVRLETNRPKTSSGVSADTTVKSGLSDRPKTATFRIALPMAVEHFSSDKSVMIDEMLGVSAKEELTNRAELLDEQRKIYENYHGLFYRDPSRRSTWRGVDELLAAAPTLRHEKDVIEANALIPVGSRDLRWAGQTLNSYRPWSPVRAEPHSRTLRIDTHALSAQAVNNATPSAASSRSSARHRSGNNTPSPTKESHHSPEERGEIIEVPSPPQSPPKLTIPPVNNNNVSVGCTPPTTTATKHPPTPSPVATPVATIEQRKSINIKRHSSMSAVRSASSADATAAPGFGGLSASPTAAGIRRSLQAPQSDGQQDLQSARPACRASASSIDFGGLSKASSQGTEGTLGSRSSSPTAAVRPFSVSSAHNSRLVGNSSGSGSPVRQIPGFSLASPAADMGNIVTSASLDNVRRTRGASATRRPPLLINLITRNTADITETTSRPDTAPMMSSSASLRRRK